MEGVRKLTISCGLRNFNITKSKPQAHTTYGCGIWTNILQLAQERLKTNSNTKSVSEPVFLHYRGASTALGNLDSNRHTPSEYGLTIKIIDQQWNKLPKGKSTDAINRIFRATIERQPKNYSPYCVPRNTRGRKHSVVKWFWDQMSLGNTSCIIPSPL